jgi:hypothetical protein
MQVAFFETFQLNPRTCEPDIWMGTATAETIRKHGLYGDPFPWWGDESLAVDGWGFKSPDNPY